MAWLTGWTYRKSHTLAGSTAGAQTNYQKRVIVHRASDSDSGEDVYVDTKCEADFGDVRFTKADGDTLLDYWLEDVTGTVGTFWVEVDTIPEDPDTINIYVYYGKSAQATTSSGDNTFLFFDDIEVDLSKWSLDAGTPVQTTDQAYRGSNSMELDGTSVSEVVSWSFGSEQTDVAFEWSFYDDSSDTNCNSYCWLRDQNNDAWLVGVSTADGANYLWFDGSWHDSGLSRTTAWHKVIVTCEGNGANDIFLDGNTLVSNGGANFSGIRRIFQMHATSVKMYYDTFFMREFVDPEPAHGAWGGEESIAVVGIQLLVDGGVHQLLVDGGVIQKIVT